MVTTRLDAKLAGRALVRDGTSSQHGRFPIRCKDLDVTSRSDPATAPGAGPAILPLLYAGAVVVAALYFGRELVVPLVLASLLAFVLAPACTALQRLKLPRAAAVTIVVLLAFAAIGGLGTIVGRQAAVLAGNIEAYQTTVLDKWHALSRSGGLLGRLTQPARADTGAGDGQDTALPFGLGEGSGLTIARSVAQPLLGPLETFGVVLVFTIFILVSSEDLRDRLVRLLGRQDLHRTILAMNDAAGRLSQYFLMQLALNAGFGVYVTAGQWQIGRAHV